MGWIVPTAQLELTSTHYKISNNNTNTLINIIGQMSSPFVSQRNTFQALLQIEDYFEPIQFLTLAIIEPAIKALAMTKALEQCQPVIAEAGAIVFKEMLINPAFMQIVTRGFNQIITMRSLQQQSLLSVISDYVLTTNDLIKALNTTKNNKDVTNSIEQLKQLNKVSELLF